MRLNNAGRAALISGCVPLGALALYLYTAYPEPGWIDSGFLAACSHHLDIPHPTAKQLYILISRVFVVLLPGNFWPLTFLAALAVSGALWVVALIRFSTYRRTCLVSGAVASLVLATTPLVWEQGTINEVHGLQLLLFALFLYFWWDRSHGRRLPMLFYLASLAFANHGTAIFLAPFLMDILRSERARLRSWLTAAGFSALGLSLFLYFPLRSAAGPLLDWGGTSAWGGFLRHATGWQFSVWLRAGDPEQFLERFHLFGVHLWDSFPWALLPMAMYGLWVVWRRSRRMTVTMLAGLAICAVFGAMYRIPDIESYYLLAVLLVGCWIAAGMASLMDGRRTLGYLAMALAILCVSAKMPQRFARLNQRHFHVATDWVRDALETVEPGSVVLSNAWDHYSPWFYLRHVEGLRPDVFWLYTRLVARSWYPAYIRKVAPERYRRAEPAFQRLAPLVARFEGARPEDPYRIEAAYGDALYAFSLGQPGPVYVDRLPPAPGEWGDPVHYMRDAPAVARGLLIRALREGESVEPLASWPDYRNWNVTGMVSERTAFHLDLYDTAYAAWRAQR